MGRGARAFIKNAEALERFEKVDTLIIDKTGTLTEGKPAVTALITAPGLTKPRCCASLPALSAETPLAHAIVNAANARGLAQRGERFQLPGRPA